MTTRRGFLGAVLASAMAPAIVKASSLMPIYVPKIITPAGLILWGDGIHDDTLALKTLIGGGVVFDAVGNRLEAYKNFLRIPPGTYSLNEHPHITRSNVSLIASKIIYTQRNLSGFTVDADVRGCIVSSCSFQSIAAKPE